jgi:tRNA-(ms[2]io[6]A)-hydroxylase
LFSTMAAMAVEPTTADLPLTWPTPASWAVSALSDPLKLLNDHAHLEKKAASNALDLLVRWPEPNPPENWVAAMTVIARDEAEHLGVVTRLLSRRGGRLTRSHRNPYANGLRELVRMGEGPKELLDRLLVSALIEVRSCERFALLADACEDQQMARLYRGLWASEHGHYLMFLQLGQAILPEAAVERRWKALLNAEAKLIAVQSPGPRIHSGVDERLA